MKFINLICCILIVGLPICMFAGDSGDTGLAFLKVDVDSRSAAMAGAFTAMATDATAAYWNPAGLAANDHRQLSLTHHVSITDITQEYASVKFSKAAHHFGVSVNVYNIPGIEVRGEAPTADPDGVVDALNFYGALSYARAIGDNWQVGATAKYLYEKLYLNSASGWAFDIGVRRAAIIKGLNWGLTLQNLGQMNKLKDQETPLPMLARTGFAYTIPYAVLGHQPLVAADLEYIKDGETSFRFGTEIPLLDQLAFRVGYRHSADYSTWTTGLGLNYKQFNFDYAYVPDAFSLGSSHRFSVGFYF